MTRIKLPNRRGSTAFDFWHEGINYVATYSRYDDGRLAELFLDVQLPAHPGDSIDAMAKDMATLVSIALQHGISEDEILASLSQEKDGTMRGPLGMALQIIRADPPDRPDAMTAVRAPRPIVDAGGAAAALERVDV